jgi:hypothetical protein
MFHKITQTGEIGGWQSLEVSKMNGRGGLALFDDLPVWIPIDCCMLKVRFLKNWHKNNITEK